MFEFMRLLYPWGHTSSYYYGDVIRKPNSDEAQLEKKKKKDDVLSNWLHSLALNSPLGQHKWICFTALNVWRHYLSWLNVSLNFTEKRLSHSTATPDAPCDWTPYNRFLNKRTERGRKPSICCWKNNLCYKVFSWGNRALMGFWINQRAWQVEAGVSDPAVFPSIILISSISWFCSYATRTLNAAT